MSSAEAEVVNRQWDEWFDAQFDLNERIERAVKGISAGKGDGFRVALYAAVIEHCAEAMRTYIPDVALAPVDDSAQERTVTT